ncbi:MAG: citramalate synthase [Nitrospirae bacterium]|nr:citramalate synthase [Nitrospirota bacterium]
MSGGKVYIYDTTLRDGTQGEGVNFSARDKVRVLHLLDDLGIDYVEGGYPGSNPRDRRFFELCRTAKLRHSHLVAFGMTHKTGRKPDSDPLIDELVQSGAEAFAIVGKTSLLHVREVLGTTPEENLQSIHDTLRYLAKFSKELIFDAEHFFDAFKEDRDHAFKALDAAKAGGAAWLVLCDTNGGSLTHEVVAATRAVVERFSGAGVGIGIHTHNDGELAVANALAAVEAGATQVHGTMNGFGERCGNANLCSIIPNLELKMGCQTVGRENLKKLREVSHLLFELANIVPPRHQPYVGDAAFAHKGGMHVSGVTKVSRSYEHVDPEAIGNRRRVLVSDLSGGSNVVAKAREYGVKVDTGSKAVQAILAELKDLENRGYEFEGAEGSFELLMQRLNGRNARYFKLLGFRVIDEKRKEGEAPISEATIMIEVDGVSEHTAAVGNGPVNALDNALRKALEKFYPAIREVELRDYKVRVLTGDSGTGAQVRVLIESGDHEDTWGTVGVSHNIIEASWQALVDSLAYKLYKDEKRRAVAS